MGGYGSGRTGGRPLAETSLALSISALIPGIRRAVAEGVTLTTPYAWSRNGTKVAEILLRITPDPGLILAYARNNEAVRETIRLTSTSSNLPGNTGRRWWFVCARCGRRCGVLYAPSGFWRCRTCHDVTYQSSCASDKRVSWLLGSGLLGRIEPGMLPVSMLVLSMKALDMMRARHARELRKAERAAKRQRTC